jgi:hypothetical protein
VHSGDRLLVTTHHRDLRRKAYGNYFRVWIDTRTSHPGPDFVIPGGLSDGTDWATGRATRRWHTRIDPVDDIGVCSSGVDISWSTDNGPDLTRPGLPGRSPGPRQGRRRGRRR